MKKKTVEHLLINNNTIYVSGGILKKIFSGVYMAQKKLIRPKVILSQNVNQYLY